MRGNLKDVIALAWPMVVGMLSYTVIDLTDTLVVGWLGKTELAAVGIATAVMFLVNSFFVGFFEGVKILVAQATGAKQHGVAKHAAWHGMALAIPCGLLVCLLIFAKGPIFALFGGSENVQLLAGNFFTIRVLSSPLWYVMISLVCFYQGRGNTILPMQINLLVCLLNVIFDIIFTFYGIGPIPALGFIGPAYATFLSILVGTVLIFIKFLKDYGLSERIQLSLMRKLTTVGFPVGIRFFLQVSIWSVCTSFIAHMGDAYIAANQITTKVLSVSFLPSYGFGEAGCVLTGLCVGARDEAGVSRSYYAVVKLAAVIAAICGAISFFFGRSIAELFQSDPEIVSIATALLMIAAFCQFFDALVMTAAGALNGTGDTQFTMFAQIGGTWLITLPLGYLFGVVFKLQAAGVWYAFTLESALVSMILILRFRSGKWKNRSLVSASK